MGIVFFWCALIAGAIFLVQFAMTIIGFGADDLDFVDVDIADAADLDVGDMQGEVHDHGSTWFFGVISFRTVVAAVMFFGLMGLAVQEGLPGQPMVALLVATCAGAAAMYGVHYLMQLMLRLKHDGTVKIERSVGKRGTVYIPIPGGNSGSGKVQLRMQDRIMEYKAMTGGSERLATGTPVEVVDVINHNTVEVRSVSEAVETA
jgi:membrane protein implicated in regulation of membrane protease activity